MIGKSWTLIRSDPFHRSATRRIFLSILLLLLFCLSCKDRTNPPRPIETAFYIWQQDWQPAVAESVQQAKLLTDLFMVFAAEGTVTNGQPDFRRMRIDWPALSRAQKPVAMVIRMNAGFAKLLQPKEKDAVIKSLNSCIASLQSRALQNKVRLAGIQLDYDCPTARLDDYAELMAWLRRQNPNLKWSITALPTWTPHRHFRNLVRDLDYFVLQAHSIEKPKSSDSPIILCDKARIPGWLHDLRKIKTAYYLALPTYGYHVVFSGTGRFVGLIAENAAVLQPREGYRIRSVIADPAAIASTVRWLRLQRPKGCRGIAWFRMPVATDQLNWAWPTVRAVIQGRIPRHFYAAEIRHPEPGLNEVWIRNSGEQNPLPGQRIRLTLDWRNNRIRAYDVLNGYREDETASTLIGLAPFLGYPILAAWYRIDPAPNQPPPKPGKVEILP